MGTRTVADIARPGTKVEQLDIREVRRILPHRYPFLMIDRVAEFVDNERVVAIKNVTINEPFFNGHFPDLPVMPGVLMIEAMAQAGAILAHRSTDGIGPGKTMMIVGVQDFKWKRQVVPGDTLRIAMHFVKRRRPLWIMQGEAFVGETLVAGGTMSAMEVD